MSRKLMLFLIFLSIFSIAVSFNTLDQMIIRYKYYDYWRSVEHWEMSFFFIVHWWLMYVASILGLILGGFLIGVISVLLLRKEG